jgi:hypothetical protein
MMHGPALLALELLCQEGRVWQASIHAHVIMQDKALPALKMRIGSPLGL